MKAELQQICAQLLASTVNGVYQGILVALVVGLLLRLLVRTNAATRHAIWFATLWLLVLAIPTHYWLLQRAAREQNRPSDRAAGRTVDPSAGEPPDPAFAFLPWTPGGVGEGEDSPSALDGSRPPSEGQARQADFLSVPFLSQSSAAGTAVSSDDGGLEAAGWWRQVLARVMHPVCWNLESAAALPILAVVLSLWAAIALVRLSALGVRLFQLSGLKQGAGPPGRELAGLFARLCREQNNRRTADLRISEQPLGPLVAGFGRPFILLPKDLAAQPDLMEAEHVLRHELAHLRRYDDWANLLQQVVQAVLFFHPAVWWIGKELTLQREIACDDYVLAHAGGRRSYALTLTSVAGRIRQPAPLLAPGVSNSKSQLQQRINMILNTRRNSAPGLAKARLVSVLSATSVLGALALCAGPRLGLAQAAVNTAASGTTSSTTAAAVAPASASDTSSATIAVAQADETAPPTPAIDSGPKFKSDSADQEPVAPAEVSAPEAPDAPVPPVPANRVARAGKPGKAKYSSDQADENGDNNPSVEARLRRLEKMVKELMSQQNPKHSHGYAYLKDGGDQNVNVNQQMLDKMKQSAERQAARAAEQAERFAEQAKRMTKDFEARQGQEDAFQGQSREVLQRQLEALRKAREGLGQEIQQLDRQIEKLQRQQERGDKDAHRRSDNAGAKLQAQTEPSPEAAN